MQLDIDTFTRALRQALLDDPPVAATGKVFEVLGTLIRVSGMNVKLGELCELRDRAGLVLQKAEVVGLSRSTAILSPFDHWRPDFGMNCVGCPIAAFHSVDEASRAHGIDGHAVLAKLRSVAGSA